MPSVSPPAAAVSAPFLPYRRWWPYKERCCCRGAAVGGLARNAEGPLQSGNIAVPIGQGISLGQIDLPGVQRDLRFRDPRRRHRDLRDLHRHLFLAAGADQHIAAPFLAGAHRRRPEIGKAAVPAVNIVRPAVFQICKAFFYAHAPEPVPNGIAGGGHQTEGIIILGRARHQKGVAAVFRGADGRTVVVVDHHIGIAGHPDRMCFGPRIFQ